MLLGLHHRITTAGSVKISRTDCRPDRWVPRNFRARLATRLIRTRGWEDLCGPAVAETSRSLAVVFGCMSWYLSAGNGRSDFHILLFNEHSAPPSSRALNWLTCDASSPPVIWSRIAPTPSPGFGLVPETKRGRKVEPGSVSACSLAKDAILQLRRDRKAFNDFFSMEISKHPVWTVLDLFTQAISVFHLQQWSDSSCWSSMDLPGLDPGSAGWVSSTAWRPGGGLRTPGCRGLSPTVPRTKASQGIFLGLCVDSCVLVCNHYWPVSTLHSYISD